MLNDEVGDDEIFAELEQLIGKTGETATPLRPGGKAMIEGRKRDVVAQFGVIDSGTPVEVVKLDGINLVVKAKA